MKAIAGILTTLILLHPPAALALSGKPNSFRVVLAAGNALGLGSARLGFGSWEFGLLNPAVIGAAKQNFISEDLYATFGFGLAISLESGAALYGGVGWEPRMFWNVYFRGEMNASAATSGQTIGGLLAGLSVRF